MRQIGPGLPINTVNKYGSWLLVRISCLAVVSDSQFPENDGGKKWHQEMIENASNRVVKIGRLHFELLKTLLSGPGRKMWMFVEFCPSRLDLENRFRYSMSSRFRGNSYQCV